MNSLLINYAITQFSSGATPAGGVAPPQPREVGRAPQEVTM